MISARDASLSINASVEPGENTGSLGRDRGIGIEFVGQGPGLVGQQSQEGVDGQFVDLLRRFPGDVLDIDSPRRADHEHRSPGLAVQDNPHVGFVGDLHRLGHQYLPDRQALDVHAQDLARLLVRLIGRRSQFHAARLAPAADVNLCLDHHPSSQLFRDTPGFFRGSGHLFPWDRHPVPGEDALRLVFVYIQFELLVCS